MFLTCILAFNRSSNYAIPTSELGTLIKLILQREKNYIKVQKRGEERCSSGNKIFRVKEKHIMKERY